MVNRWRAPTVILLVGALGVGALLFYRWDLLRDECPPGTTWDDADAIGCSVVPGLQAGIPVVLSLAVAALSLLVAAMVALRPRNEPR